LELARKLLVTQRRRNLTCALLGGVHVALDFAQSDWPLGVSPVVMKDRIVRVLPPLLHQAGFRLTRIFDEAVPVPVAVVVDPLERPSNGRPQMPQGTDVVGRRQVLRSQHYEERCRINTAIVAPKRNLLEPSHLAFTGLVEDLSWFGVTGWIHL